MHTPPARGRLGRTLGALAGCAAVAMLPACGCAGGDVDDAARSAASSPAHATSAPATIEAASDTDAGATTAETVTATVLTPDAPTGAESAAPSPSSSQAAPAGDDLDAPAAPSDAAAATDVAETIDRYIDAFRDRRGADGCRGMTANAQQALLDRAAAEGLDASSCAVALEAASDGAGGATRTALAFADVEDVRTDGDRASATVDVLGQRYPVELERQGGRWLIAELPPV